MIGGILVMLLLLGFVLYWHLSATTTSSLSWHERIAEWMGRPANPSESSDEEVALIDSLIEAQAINLNGKAEYANRIVRMHTFDPNHADSAELVEVGLLPWQAHNLIRYRTVVREKNGGRAAFRKPESLLRLSWMSDSLYTAIRPYIVLQLTAEDTIYPVDSTKYLLRRQYIDSLRRDSFLCDSAYAARKIAWQQQKPVKKDTIIDLNHCDTTDLKYVRHIGSYSAKRIAEYGKELGGYVSVEQLRDPELRLPRLQVDSIIPYMTVSTDFIVQINVNTTPVGRMYKHPYISTEMAIEIRRVCLDHRIRSAADLQRYFRPQYGDLQRVLPYLSY